MDEKQLRIEFMSLITESHPGLTFEEYRDCCVFLLFYEYCCLKYDSLLEDRYKLKELVRMALRGKLQIPSFLTFMENASAFIHLHNGYFYLRDFSFCRMLDEMHSQEKQKSYARFIRKIIKKIDSWNCDELLYSHFPSLFHDLMIQFARAKKETYISDSCLNLYRLLFESVPCEGRNVFVPEFQYGILFDGSAPLQEGASPGEDLFLYGYESNPVFLEIVRVLYFMRGASPESVHLMEKGEWNELGLPPEKMDRVAVFMPDGVEAGNLILESSRLPWNKDLLGSRSKGELPFVMSALPILEEKGTMAAILPSALLYREGKESQIRRYLIQELNCLETVILLPDQMFLSAGQQEAMLFFRMNRDRKDIMFFDCTDQGNMGDPEFEHLKEVMDKRESIPGFSACVDIEDIRKNDYNLNLPRYIAKTVRDMALDLEERKKRIAEIDRELTEIDQKMIMYRRALELV